MTRAGHIPVRTCVGCRTRRPKGELVRAVLRDGRAVVDTDQALPGRGAYLCAHPGCLQTAIKRRAFDRALRTKNVNLDVVTSLLAGRPEPRFGAEGIE